MFNTHLVKLLSIDGNMHVLQVLCGTRLHWQNSQLPRLGKAWCLCSAQDHVCLCQRMVTGTSVVPEYHQEKGRQKYIN